MVRSGLKIGGWNNDAKLEEDSCDFGFWIGYFVTNCGMTRPPLFRQLKINVLSRNLARLSYDE
jgi:hypothetical protein